MDDEPHKKMLDREYRQPELRDPLSDYQDMPNPEAAFYGREPGIVDKALGTLGIGRADLEKRQATPWGRALSNTIHSQSIGNMIHDITKSWGRAKEGPNQPDVGQTTMGLSNIPILSGWSAMATGAMPRGSLGSMFHKGPTGEHPPAGIGHNNPVTEVPGRQLDYMGFYSKAVEEARKLQMKQGTPEQYINALDRAGVKPKELYWMGLAELNEKGKPIPSQTLRYLARMSAGDNKGKMSRDDFIKLAEERQIRPAKHELDTESGMDDEALRDSMYEDAMERANDLEVKPDKDAINDIANRLEIEDDPNHPGRWRVVDDDRRADYPDDEREWVLSDNHLTSGEADRARIEYAEENARDMGVTSWGLYDHDGNQVHSFDYDPHGQTGGRGRGRGRDGLEDAANEARHEWAQGEVEHMDEDEYRRSIGEDPPAKHLNYMEDRPGGSDAGEDYREVVYNLANNRPLTERNLPDFNRSHYSEYPNVIGHWLMHNYHDAATGDPVTFANEGQSDWRKALTKYGERKVGPELDAISAAFRQAKADEEALHDKIAYTNRGQNYTVASGSGLYPDIPRDLAHQLMEWDRNIGRLSRNIGDLNRANRGSDPNSTMMYGDREMNVSQMEAERENIEQQKANALAQYKQLEGPELEQYQNESDRLLLRRREAENAFNQATQGVPPGPFVGDISEANNFLAKLLLTEAAKGREGSFLSWSTPEIIKARWPGADLEEQYKSHLPNTLLKLAKEHDPNAELTSVHIGDYDPNSTAPATYHYATTDRIDPNQMELPLGTINDQGAHELNLGQGYNTMRNSRYPYEPTGRTMSVRNRPTGVTLAPRRTYNPEFQPRGTEPELYSYAASSVHGPNAWQGIAPVYSLETMPGTAHGAFKTPEAAQSALKDLQENFDTRDDSLESKKKNYDLTETPAIRMTPRLRESIKKRGFSMFVNPPIPVPGISFETPPYSAADILARDYPDET